MRTTLRVIAAAFALLLATPALGASEFDIANAEHDANGGTNGAKRTTIVDSAGTAVVSPTSGVKTTIVDAAGTAAISATSGVKASLVDSSGDSAVDATANAVKVVHVDNAGTALVGGRGSRVELLSTGTKTTVTPDLTITLVEVDRPAWAHSIQIVWAIEACVVGASGNMSMSAGFIDANDNNLGSLGALTVRTAAAPAASQGGIATFGPAHPSVAALATASSLSTYGNPHVGPTVRVNYAFATTGPTSITIRYSAYGIGG